MSIIEFTATEKKAKEADNVEHGSMFQLPEVVRLLRDSCRQFATRRIAKQAAEADRLGRVDPTILRALGRIGLLGVSIQEAWGGSGMSKLAYAVAVEEISRACASTGAIMSVHHLYCHCLQTFGTDLQKKEFLTDYASGQKIGAFALTEPDCGSDASALKSTAERLSDGSWTLNGEKTFVSNGSIAGAVVVFVRAYPHGREASGRLETQTHRGISAFLVPTDTPGFILARDVGTMGIRAAPCSSLILRDCRVPATALLGSLEQGFEIAMSELDGGRIGMAAQALGIGAAALELATNYSRDRQAFGQPIGKLQAIQLKLADMRTRLESARLLTWRAACLADADKRFTVESAMAKLAASEMATYNAHQAIQVLGGYGFCTEFEAERLYRDARITEIYEGTSEIMRIVIARHSFKGGY